MMASKATPFSSGLHSAGFLLGPLARPPRNEHVTRASSVNSALSSAPAIVHGALANFIDVAMLVGMYSTCPRTSSSTCEK